MAIVQGIYIFEDGSNLPPDGTAPDWYSFDATVLEAKKRLLPVDGSHFCKNYNDPEGNEIAHTRGWIGLAAQTQEDFKDMDFHKAATLFARRVQQLVSALQFIRFKSE